MWYLFIVSLSLDLFQSHRGASLTALGRKLNFNHTFKHQPASRARLAIFIPKATFYFFVG